MTLSPRSRRLGGLTALAAVAALATSACTFVSPRETNDTYPPSDGTMTSIALADGTTVSLHNVLIISESQGGPGRVVGALETSGQEAVTVSLTADFGDAEPAAPIDVQVEPGSLTVLGDEGEDVVLPAVGAAPGAFVEMTASTPQGGSTEWQVPVLPPVYPYEGLAPTEVATPAATETVTN